MNEPVTLIDNKPEESYTVTIKPKGPMILCAEDLPFNRFAIKHVFEAELGLFANQFMIVENGKQAIDEVVKQSQSFNKLKLVLLDYNMPKYNGLEALGWIQQYYEENEISNRPIIAFLSAYIPDREKAKAMDLGASIFLEKPIDPEKIRELMLNAGISLLPVAKGQ
jgi:CheY-like chemotaxis protein